MGPELAAAAEGAGPVVLVVVVGLRGGLALQLGQPGGVVELGVLVAAAPLGPLAAALSPPGHRYAATLPVFDEVKLRSPNTISR